MNEFKMRLVAHDPKTHERLGVLPDALSVDIGLPRLDVTTAQVSYPLAGVRSELVDRRIQDGLCVSIQVAHATKYGPQDWTELPGGYMVLHARSTDPSKTTSDGGQVMDCQLMSYVAYHLNGAMLRPDKLAKYDSEGKRQFLSATPGAIMLTFIQELQRRGELAGVEAGFTSTRDSNGKPWEQIVTLAVSEGEVDALTMLRSLADQGACDWTVDGRTLRMVNMDGDTRDLSVGKGSRDPVRLIIGTDVADAPQTESVESLVQEILVIGEDGKTELITDPTAPSPYGKRSAVVTQGGVSDAGTMRSLGTAQLKKLSMIESELTRELLLHDPRQLPMIDYKPGDWVTGPGPDGKAARLRVAQVTLQVGSEGDVASGHVILGTRKLDLLLRMTRRMVGITGGSKADGGSGVRPAPGGPDKRRPAKVEGLVADSEAYFDPFGVTRSLINAAWGEVSTDANGVAMEVTGYEVDVRNADATTEKGYRWRRFYSGNATAWTDSPFTPGTRYELRARARGPVNPGPWSDLARVTGGADNEPPPIPAKPMVSAMLGVIRATWSGKGSKGEAMPPDFKRVEVSVMDTSSLDPAAPQPSMSTVHDVIDRAASGIVITGRKGMQTYVRFRSVDDSGNKSEWSDEAHIVAEARVDVDDIWGVITDPDMLGPDLITEKHIVASESLWAKLGKFVQIDVGMLNANEIWSDDAWIGHARAQIVNIGGINPRDIGWSGDELAPNPVWMDAQVRAAFPAATGWQYRAAADVPAKTVTNGQTHILTVFGSVVAGTTHHMKLSEETPVAPGDKVSLEMVATSGTDQPGWRVALQAVCVMADGSVTRPASMRLNSASDAPAGKVSTLSGVFKVPDGVRGIYLSVSNYGPSTDGAWYISRVSGRKAMASQSETGEGLEITPRGIHGWDANGEDVLRLGVDLDALVVSDTFRTGTRTSGPQVMLSNTIIGTGLPGVWFSDTGTFGNDSSRIYLRDMPEGQVLGIRSAQSPDGRRPPVYAEGGISVGPDSASTPRLTLDSNGNLVTNDLMRFLAGRSGGYDQREALRVDSVGDLPARASLPTTPDNWTTGNAANMYIGGSTGNVFMCTSVRAAKLNITTVAKSDIPDPLSLRPVHYRDKSESENRARYLSGDWPEGEPEPNVPRRFLGLIAEEVEAAGLTDLVTYDEDGKLQGVAYERLSVALLPIIREQRDQIAALTARIEALEAA